MENTQLEQTENKIPPLETALFKKPPPTLADLYDADVEQTHIFVDDADEGFEVTVKTLPVSDADYIQYANDSRNKLTDDGTMLEQDSIKAMLHLWKIIADDLTGFDGDKPSDWKELVDFVQIVQPVITKVLVVAAWSDIQHGWAKKEKVVFTEAKFNDEVIKCQHFLREKTTEDIKAYNKFRRVPLGAKTKGLSGGVIVVPSYAKSKGELYDRMQVKQAFGYTGRVPLHHKEAVIDDVFNSGAKQKK